MVNQLTLQKKKVKKKNWILFGMHKLEIRFFLNFNLYIYIYIYCNVPSGAPCNSYHLDLINKMTIYEFQRV